MRFKLVRREPDRGKIGFSAVPGEYVWAKLRLDIRGIFVGVSFVIVAFDNALTPSLASLASRTCCPLVPTDGDPAIVGKC